MVWVARSRSLQEFLLSVINLLVPDKRGQLGLVV